MENRECLRPSKPDQNEVFQEGGQSWRKQNLSPRPWLEKLPLSFISKARSAHWWPKSARPEGTSLPREMEFVQALRTPWNRSRALCFSPLTTSVWVKTGFKGGEVYWQVHLMSQAGNKNKRNMFPSLWVILPVLSAKQEQRNSHYWRFQGSLWHVSYSFTSHFIYTWRCQVTSSTALKFPADAVA